ncbi:MAG: hypothetical protein NZ602_06250 [Thermoguttaceae bacterium]|nr:hypothetical protein [Thermoguttaceae bacterium]MDW8036927.1 hypothetical protein [Thermoguttaceae bacterium]
MNKRAVRPNSQEQNKLRKMATVELRGQMTNVEFLYLDIFPWPKSLFKGLIFGVRLEDIGQDKDPLVQSNCFLLASKKQGEPLQNPEHVVNFGKI